VASQLGWKKRLLFTGVLALFVASCVEILLQAAYYATSGAFLFRRTLPPIFELDPSRCYRVKPNLDFEQRTNEFRSRIYTNAQGFRTDSAREPIPEARRPGAVRMLFLGPSFTFGWGADFEDTYPALIADALRRAGRDVELLNAGTPAQGSGPQLCWLREEGARFRPDLVVQTVYDRVTSLAASCPEVLECPVVQDGKLYSQPPTLALRAIAFAKNFATVFYGYYLYQALLSPPGPAEQGTGRELYGREDGGADAAAVADMVATYRGYVDFVRGVLGAEVRVVFLYVPLSFAVHPEDEPRWRHLGVADHAARREQARRRIEALREAGIAIVDTSPLLRDRGRSERMYYWLDIHFTPAGNGAAADAAVPAIEAILAAPAPARGPR
jgi:lysophospholipase L1-like esterase